MSLVKIIEVWLIGSEPTIIRMPAFVQQLSVRKDTRSFLRCLIKDENFYYLRSVATQQVLELIGRKKFQRTIHTTG